MRDRLLALLEKADLALASCAGVIEDETLVPLIGAVGDVRTRLAYPEDVLVVALGGGTGSGKSSLFNAFTGEELVDTGGVRPTTSSPAAAVPVPVGAAVDTYLDRMGVDERHTYDGTNICLLDLPDTDSVETDHRHRAETLLPRVDLVVWVTDPEKYRDARLHHDYLRPLAGSPDQVVFVMNQIDRLSPDQTDTVLADLALALEEDGLEEPRIIPTAAAPRSGPPTGLEELGAVLAERGTSRDTLYDRLLDDLTTTTRILESEAGSGLDFDTRAAVVVDEAAGNLLAGDLGGASDVVTGFLDGLAAEAGGLTAEMIEGVAADVAAHLRRIGDGLPKPETARRRRSWWRRHRDVPVADDARGQLAEAIIRPVRAILARRAVAIASIAELAVDARRLRERATG